MNDKERQNWVLNDEGLYNLQRRSHMSMRRFITDNRDMIDRVINKVVSGEKPAHYLEYE